MHSCVCLKVAGYKMANGKYGTTRVEVCGGRGATKARRTRVRPHLREAAVETKQATLPVFGPRSDRPTSYFRQNGMPMANLSRHVDYITARVTQEFYSDRD